MVRQAATEPLAVQQLAAEERTRVDKELVQEEQAGRAVLAGRRKGALASTGQQAAGHEDRTSRSGATTLAKEINDRYKAVQDHVKSRLADLDTQSMKRFDEGNCGCGEGLRGRRQPRTRGLQGRPLLGLVRLGAQGEGLAARHGQATARQGDLRPQSRGLREAHREAGGGHHRRQRARDPGMPSGAGRTRRTKIDEYVRGLEPGLQDIGKKAAGEMQEKLDLLDKDIARERGGAAEQAQGQADGGDQGDRREDREDEGGDVGRAGEGRSPAPEGREEILQLGAREVRASRCPRSRASSTRA